MDGKGVVSILATDGSRVNPKLDTQEVILGLGIGEAVISMLAPKGLQRLRKRCRFCHPRAISVH